MASRAFGGQGPIWGLFGGLLCGIGGFDWGGGGLWLVVGEFWGRMCKFWY